MKKIINHPFFIRLFHWEYWPFHVVYGFLYPYWLFLCLKARTFFFFSSANPSIKNGGFLMESKKAIYDLIPENYYPKTLLFNQDDTFGNVLAKVYQHQFQFPLVGKPDIGMRGMAVMKLANEKDLKEYISQSKVDFLIQEFVPYGMEAGIFYYRYPGGRQGRISGIVLKEFLTVEGNGVSSILELVKKDQRSILQLDALKKQYGNRLDIILSKGEQKLLVPYGNHSRGAKFLDASHLIDEQLTNVIDKVCRQVRGFYYGRLDVRFRSWGELRQGKCFSIIELNGAGSEPTHIYDPKHSIFFAWKEIIKHWNILYKISRINKTISPSLSFRDGIKMFKESTSYTKLLQK